MWTLLLMYALRSLYATDTGGTPQAHAEQAAPPALQLPAPAEGEVDPADLTVDEIIARDPLVRDYVQQRTVAATELERLRLVYGPNHPRVREAVSRERVLALRVDELAAKYRRNPKTLASYQNPEIRRSLQAIDQIDIELDMLRPNAGPTHPRVRTLRHFREQHEKQIEKVLWGGTT